MSKQFYYELKVIPPSEYYNLFLDFLLEISDIGLEELDGSLILRSENSFQDIRFAINYFAEQLSKKFGEKIDIEVSEEKKENIDWIKKFQESIKPIYIPPFYIHQSWNSPKDGAENIIIDPALAFGSGHHETTSSVIELLVKIVGDSDGVLDIGTGSGILAIVSAKLGAVVDFCDIDEVAVESAKENFQKNGLQFRNCWVGSANGTDEKYSIVLANIVADVIVAISNQIADRVQEGGYLVLSGILVGNEDRVLDFFPQFTILDKIIKNEWITLLLKKDS